MIFTIFSVLYVLIAAAMIVLILMQRGDGANAGASFGGGSSGTVFGARGAASFLTRTTAVLAGVFFVLTLGMGMYLSHNGAAPSARQQLGIMAGVKGSAPATSAPAAGAPAATKPATSAPPSSAPGSEIPGAAGAAQGEVPAAPKASTPATSAPAGNAAGKPTR